MQAAHTLYKKNEEIDKDEAYSDTDDESSNKSQKSTTSSREELGDIGTPEIMNRRQQKVDLEKKKSQYEEKLEVFIDFYTFHLNIYPNSFASEQKSRTWVYK